MTPNETIFVVLALVFGLFFIGIAGLCAGVLLNRGRIQS